MTDDLVKRLRKVEPDAPGERTRWYRNPDGPEAADRIEALEAALRKGQYMRQRQKQYFKDRTRDNLVGSKQAEAAFDRALAEEKKEQEWD